MVERAHLCVWTHLYRRTRAIHLNRNVEKQCKVEPPNFGGQANAIFKETDYTGSELNDKTT